MSQRGRHICFSFKGDRIKVVPHFAMASRKGNSDDLWANRMSLQSHEYQWSHRCTHANAIHRLVTIGWKLFGSGAVDCRLLQWSHLWTFQVATSQKSSHAGSCADNRTNRQLGTLALLQEPSAEWLVAGADRLWQLCSVQRRPSGIFKSESSECPHAIHLRSSGFGRLSVVGPTFGRCDSFARRSQWADGLGQSRRWWKLDDPRKRPRNCARICPEVFFIRIVECQASKNF